MKKLFFGNGSGSGQFYLIYGWLIIFLIIGLQLTNVGCTSKKLIVPPVTEMPTRTYHPGKFVWHDLLTDKVQEVKKFYGGLFGWEFEGEDSPKAAYTLIKYDGKPIGGIVYSDQKRDVNESQWLSYLSVPDVDAATEFVKESGGTVYRKPWDLTNRGRLSVVADPQGALLVLFRSSTGDPADSEPELNTWLWTELLARHDSAAVSFYEQLVGYSYEANTVRDTATYYVLSEEKEPRAGVLQNPFINVPSNWLPYVRVEDPAALTEKVESLGGKVFLKPREDVRKGSVALIIDPSGAAVAIQKWPY